MTPSDLLLLAGTVVTCAAAIIGVQVRLIATLADRLAGLEVSVAVLSAWHDQWANLPSDTSSATLLDRRLGAIEHRLDQIESHLDTEIPAHGP